MVEAHLTHSSWPPSEAAIQGNGGTFRVTLKGRVKPGHDVKVSSLSSRLVIPAGA
jgi:hypothetical protein